MKYTASKIIFLGAALLTAVSSLATTAYKKDNRPILTCINFKVSKQTASLVCTDSAILSATSLELISSDIQGGDLDFSLPAKELESELKALLGKCGKNANPYITITVVRDEFGNLDHAVKVESQRGDASIIDAVINEYPAVRNCMPEGYEKSESTFKVAFFVSLLEQMIQSVKKAGGDTVTLTFPNVFVEKAPKTYIRPIIYTTPLAPDFKGLATPARSY